MLKTCHKKSIMLISITLLLSLRIHHDCKLIINDVSDAVDETAEMKCL